METYIYKVFFTHDNGVTHDLCSEVIMSVTELTCEEIKNLLYQQETYNSNESVITDLSKRRVFCFGEPMVL